MIKDLPELIENQVISQEIADRILVYYQQKKKQGQNTLFVVFGVLGALLVGLGLILIIAHNWDDLSRTVKLVLAFLPLVIAQTMGGITLVRKPENTIWRESSAIFWILSIGSVISLVSQIYHISGDLSQFLLLWVCLSLPVVYLMRSAFASLLYWVGITCYACVGGYWWTSATEPYWFWLLAVAGVPFYLQLVKATQHKNLIRLHLLTFALSLTIVLETLSHGHYTLMYLAYFGLFGSFLMHDQLPFIVKNQLQDKWLGYLGFAGTMLMLFMLSSHWFWKRLLEINNPITSIEMIPLMLLLILALLLFIRKYKDRNLRAIEPVDAVFALFVPIFLIGSSIPGVGQLLANSLVLFIGVWTLLDGLKKNHIGILNLGFLLIAVLIVCRFFDSELSFITRGLLFVAVGLGFFFANYRMLRSRRNREQNQLSENSSTNADHVNN